MNVRRYCVACWADDAAGETGGQFPMRHLRCWWSVAAVTVCPIHNVRLNDRCLQCDRTIRLAGGRVTICRCGANLAQSTRIVVDAHATAADANVVGRLGGCSRVPNDILDTLPLCDAIALMQRLGCCVSAGRDARFGKTDPPDRPAMMLAGFHTVRTGDEGIEKTIDALLAAPGRPDRLRVQLGQLYSWFAALPDGELQFLDGNPHRERREAESAELAGLGAACRRTTRHRIVYPPAEPRLASMPAGIGRLRSWTLPDYGGRRRPTMPTDSRPATGRDARQPRRALHQCRCPGRYARLSLPLPSASWSPRAFFHATDWLSRPSDIRDSIRIEVDAILDRMQGNAPVVEAPPSDSRFDRPRRPQGRNRRALPRDPWTGGSLLLRGSPGPPALQASESVRSVSRNSHGPGTTPG